MWGAEAAGLGIATGQHAASLQRAGPVSSGAYSYLVQDSDGHDRAGVLDLGRSRLPGVGPEHSYLRVSGRATYLAITDAEALQAFQLLSRTEGIIRPWKAPMLSPWRCKSPLSTPAKSLLLSIYRAG
jgi:tryptophan synthase beta chain